MAVITPSSTDADPVSCLALLLAAPASGQGKTTITAGLARLLRRQGKRVRVFKTGPDYLDPQILAQASGQPVVPLDLWMAGEAWCRAALYRAAREADVILVEGAMGMFDGEPSSADLAERFGLPLVLVMSVAGMAQTAGAIVLGLSRLRPAPPVVGWIANHCNSERHRELIQTGLPASLPLLAALPQAEAVTLPERHLGLVQASEQADVLEARLEQAADWLAAHLDLAQLLSLPAVTFTPESVPAPVPQWLAGRRIGLARDAAFSFIYDANVQLLEALGATVVSFSPLCDARLPLVDALWLPGGYPELHARALAANHGLRADIRAHHQAGKPLLAECGGFLYCLESLTDLNEDCFEMLGLLPGHGAMRGKRGCQGMQTAPLPEGEVRGHAHHRSRSHGTPDPLAYGRRQRHPAPGEAIYRQGGLTATYLHLFFPSNPLAVARLFGADPSGAVG